MDLTALRAHATQFTASLKEAGAESKRLVEEVDVSLLEELAYEAIEKLPGQKDFDGSVEFLDRDSVATRLNSPETSGSVLAYVPLDVSVTFAGKNKFMVTVKVTGNPELDWSAGTEASTHLAAKKKPVAEKPKAAAPTLWKYTDPDNGQDFYLPEKKTTVKSPWSGKPVSVKPEKFSLGDVGKELKQDTKKKAAEPGVVEAADELLLYADRAPGMQPILASIAKNLVRKGPEFHGVEASTPAWRLLVDAAADAYVTELGVPGETAAQRFPESVREVAALVLAERESDKLASGAPAVPPGRTASDDGEVERVAADFLSKGADHPAVQSLLRHTEAVTTAVTAGSKAMAATGTSGAPSYVRPVLSALLALSRCAQSVRTQLDLRTQ